MDSEEIRFRENLHRDINRLRREIVQLVHAEELQFRKQFQHEIGQLRADVAALRQELALRDARAASRPCLRLTSGGILQATSGASVDPIEATLRH